MYNLRGKVAIVTEAAHRTRIGHVIAVRLAQDGADIVVVDQYFTPEMFYEIERTQARWEKGQAERRRRREEEVARRKAEQAALFQF